LKISYTITGWKEAEDVLGKVDEEVLEVKQAVENKDKSEITNEIGDLLFAIASLARKLEIDPEMPGSV